MSIGCMISIDDKKEKIYDVIDTNNGYLNIANAIAITAIEDYKKYARILKNNPNDSQAKYQLKLIMLYISKSPLFVLAFKIHPDSFIKYLKEL